jgi:hypothetical protein
MATEIVEYRPGHWVKVVDGRITERATIEEVQAWHEAQSNASPLPPDALTLDVDLSSTARGADPAQTLDVPLRPAFQRRGRPGAAPQLTPAPRAARPQANVRPSAAPAQPDKAPDRKKPRAGVRQLDTAVRASGVAVRQPKPGIPSPSAADPGSTVLVRRKATAEPEPVPASEPPANPASEVSPLPQRKPGARAEALSPTTNPRAAAPEAAATPAPATTRRAADPVAAATPVSTPEPAAAQATPSAEEEEPIRTPASQGPTYWWIWNADRQPIDAFLREWGRKYEAKFGHEMTFVFCCEADQPAVEASGFDCDVSPLLRAGHFYLSHSNGKKSES